MRSRWNDFYLPDVVCGVRLWPMRKRLSTSGGICITQRISDYIACIEAAGGNKAEIDHEIASVIKDTASGAASGSASGVILRGSGSVKLSKDGEKKVTDHLSIKYHEGAMYYCGEALKQSSADDRIHTNNYEWRRDAERLAYIYAGRAFCDKYNRIDSECINTPAGDYQLKNKTRDFFN